MFLNTVLAYGMFVRCNETRTVWFNPQSFESGAIFELTGMILGLAIYNGIILDVPLPNVLYSKLKGQKPTLEDLLDIEPTIARSLKDLLNYEGNLEEDLCLDFQVSLIMSYLLIKSYLYHRYYTCKSFGMHHTNSGTVVGELQPTVVNNLSENRSFS